MECWGGVFSMMPPLAQPPTFVPRDPITVCSTFTLKKEMCPATRANTRVWSEKERSKAMSASRMETIEELKEKVSDNVCSNMKC